jgi:hypothetical protein
MIRWNCTQCDENLEAPDGFNEVIECPNCGHHSRPVPPPDSKLPHPDLIKAEEHFMASKKAKKSREERQFDHYTDGSVRAYRIGWFMCAVAVLILWQAIVMDTTNGDVYNTGLMNNRVVITIVGSTLFITGWISIALGAIGTGIIRLMLDSINKTI